MLHRVRDVGGLDTMLQHNGGFSVGVLVGVLLGKLPFLAGKLQRPSIIALLLEILV